MSTRTFLAGLAAALAIALYVYWSGRPGPAAPVRAVTRAAPPPIVADVAPVDSPLPVDGAPTVPDVNFADGFCSGSGSESINVHYTPERLLRTKADATISSDSPWPQVEAAIAARGNDDPEAELAALRHARKLLPNDPAIGFALAAATRNTPDLDEAIDGLGTYLAVDPSAPASRLRARIEVQRDIQRDYHRETRDGITVLWPPTGFSDQQADDLAGRVDRALDDAAALTGTHRRKRLTVVVYPSRSELLAVSCVRSWTAALFDGVLRVVVDPGSPDGVDAVVVRHETLHAQLSPLSPNAPKWFQEGVAQSFAKEPPRKYMWKTMVRNRSWIPFSSLDGSFQVFSNNADADLAYTQSYAMVEMMRSLGGDASISKALGAFHGGADSATALAVACGRSEVTGTDLIDFIAQHLL